MKLHFLGGADEVGASSLLVEAAGRRVLVDAGVRMGSAEKDRLPDLGRATDLGGLDAILVTHAHLDHTGALPLVHAAFPAARVWMTEPTLGLLRILLLDALKVMGLKADREGEIPLYPRPAVEALLARASGVGFLEPVVLCEGALTATFFPAGHVLGAAAVGLETPEGNLLVTGDMSLADQLTVPGMPRPRFSPDVVVCESTYGGRLHASRRAEEQRLAQAVAEVLGRGGKVLIPAFALGRAQEVLLILRKALAREGAPEAVVHADGMVRSICGVYGQYPDYLCPALRRRAGEERGLFFTADGRVRPVVSPEEREAIAAGGPCVIVSSSGMLSGGPSALYAARLASSSESFIAITGYQDEEAPGRRLQEVASGSSRELVLDGATVHVECAVGTYALSAHADAQEIAGLVGSLRPKAVALVHGDSQARQALARTMAAGGLDRVHLPAAGDSIDFETLAGASHRRQRQVEGIGKGMPLDAAGLARLHRHIWESERKGRAFTVREIALEWHGTRGLSADLASVHALLASGHRLFAPDAKRPFFFRCVDPGAREQAAPGDSARDEAGRLEQNAALALVDSILGPESGLYRKGAEREGWRLRLYFRFPEVARPRYAAEIDAIAQRSGWQVAVHPEPHTASLEALARDLLGSESPPIRSPSVFKDERVVKAVVEVLPAPEIRRGIARRYQDLTGYALEIRGSPGKTPAAKKVRDETGRMEVNLAFAEVDKAFAGRAHRPYKKSKKSDEDGPFIELAFVSPEVGARCLALVEEIEGQTGWRMRVAGSVDQQAILRAVAEIVPSGWAVARGPGIDVPGRKVRLRLATPPPREEWEAASAALAERTGFTLEPA